MTNSRAHMMRPLESAGQIVIKNNVTQPSEPANTYDQDSGVAWNSYYDLQNSVTNSFLSGQLPNRETPVDTSKKTTMIAGKEVKRMPVLDDFAEMMRKEDVDNHSRVERYENPIGPAGGLDWFKATMLAAMIEHGRIGIKELGNGVRVSISIARELETHFSAFGVDVQRF